MKSGHRNQNANLPVPPQGCTWGNFCKRKSLAVPRQPEAGAGETRRSEGQRLRLRRDRQQDRPAGGRVSLPSIPGAVVPEVAVKSRHSTTLASPRATYASRPRRAWAPRELSMIVHGCLWTGPDVDCPCTALGG